MELRPYLFCVILSFIFFPTSFRRQWAAFLGAWCPLLAFRSCFVEFTQRLNVLLMNFYGWGEKVVSPSYSSAILGPPPILVLNFCFSIGFNCIYLPPEKASFFFTIFYMFQKHFFILYVYIYLSLMIVLSIYFMYRYTHKPIHAYIWIYLYVSVYLCACMCT